MNERRFEREPPTPEEGFEDVGLNDDVAAAAAAAAHSKPAQAPARKRAFFKFGSEQQPDGATGSPGSTATPSGGAPTTMSRFLSGRKRGQSGQGAELGAMPERSRTAVPEEQQLGGQDVAVQS